MFKKLFNSILDGVDKGLSSNNQEVENQQYSEPIYDSENEEVEEEEAFENHNNETEFDPETLHGTHYTEDEFFAEVDRRTDAWVKSEEEDGTVMGEHEIKNIKYNYRRDVYREWTGADSDQMIRWEHVNSLKFSGTASMTSVIDETNNPLLEPIHGISLKDYAAICQKMAPGIDPNLIYAAMGIDEAIWGELNTLWPKRMQEDGSFTVTTLYGKYFMDGVTHPNLEALSPNHSEETKSNLEKLKNDRYFYEELVAARQAAYQYGLDGAQWIVDHYGISLGDFQAIAMEHMTEQQKNWNSDDINHYQNYQDEKLKEYSAKFAAEQGGNVADDVEF